MKVPSGDVNDKLAPFHLLQLREGFVLIDEACEALFELSDHLSLRFPHCIKLDLVVKSHHQEYQPSRNRGSTGDNNQKCT